MLGRLGISLTINARRMARIREAGRKVEARSFSNAVKSAPGTVLSPISSTLRRVCVSTYRGDKVSEDCAKQIDGVDNCVRMTRGHSIAKLSTIPIGNSASYRLANLEISLPSRCATKQAIAVLRQLRRKDLRNSVRS